MDSIKWSAGILLALMGIAFVYNVATYDEYAQQRSLVPGLSKYKNIVPVAIIGAGPAGISASMYTARARFGTVVFGGQKIGGELLEASYVENWPAKEKMTGQQIMQQAEGQAKFFGAHIVPLEVKRVDFSTWPFVLELDNKESVHALCVIVATGGSQKLPDLKAIQEYYGKGIGICTICDAPFDKDADVAVIGGGDAACDKALQLAAYAKKVTIIVRESSMRAAAIVQEYIKANDRISILYDTELVGLQGDATHLRALTLKNKKTSQEQVLPLKTVYFALGYSPNSSLFNHQLTMDKKGYILLQSRTHKTNKPAVFAAGNVVDPFYQKSGYAAGSGIGAGLDAIAFLTQLNFFPSIHNNLKDNYYCANMTMALQPIKTLEELESFSHKQELSIVIFHAHHCPVCQEIIRFSNNAAQQLNKKVGFASIVVDESPLLLKKYEVGQTPTMLIIKNNRVEKRFERSSLKEFKEYINNIISENKS